MKEQGIDKTMNRMTERLLQILSPEQVRTGEPMSSHTTFRTGGPADWLVRPEDPGQLAGVLSLCREEHVPYYILGNGSNLLVGDGGFRGVMVDLTGEGFRRIAVEDTQVRAGAGAMLSAVARAAYQSSLTGLEFAAGIPGTIGGAVVMNAGAYGGELCQVLTQVTVLTPEGQVETLDAGELELGYRTSCIPERGYVVLEAALQLAHGDSGEIRRVMDDLAAKRKEKQPLEYPSAGSTFKRPEGYFAGKLIQDAGLRGYTVGGAQVSEKHCGFVINRGGATSGEIMALCRHVQEQVKAQFGVDLEMEVRRLGDFSEQD